MGSSPRSTRVLHALRSDSRRTTVDHAACFGRCPSPEAGRVEFVNVFGPLGPSRRTDVLIVTYDLLALRTAPYWPYLRRVIDQFRAAADTVVFFPQDDYTMCGVLDDLFVESEADFVFTPITRDLDRLYPRSTRTRTVFREALTGYVDDRLKADAAGFVRPFGERTVDIGQRIRLLPPIFGLEAREKGRLAEVFARRAIAEGFVADVSTDPGDVLIGDDWLSFLGNSRFTVGRMGGASVCDPHGALADRFRRMKVRRPGASDEELAKRVSWRGTGEGDFSAVSPRIFEAAALGVCQILVEDRYVEGLEANLHYLPLRSDLSGIEDVFAAMRDHVRCAAIARASTEFLVESDQFTYRRFVKGFWAEVTVSAGTRDVAGAEQEVSDPGASMLPLFSGGPERAAGARSFVKQAFIERRRTVERREVAEVLRRASDSNLDGDLLDATWSACNRWIAALNDGNALLEGLLVPWLPALVAAPDLRCSEGLVD